MTLYYTQDEDGNPVATSDLQAFAKEFEREGNSGTHPRVVASDHVGEIHISTVFLGIDHSFNSGKPVLWETMIFGGEHNDYQERYTTVMEAMEGHGRALKLVLESENKT